MTRSHSNVPGERSSDLQASDSTGETSINDCRAASDARLQIAVRTSLSSSFQIDVQCVMAPGITVLFGPSGSGKTSLLNCVAGLVKPDSGRIVLGSRVLFDSATGVDVRPQARRVGYVFQQLALFPHLSVVENVEYGLASQARDERRRRSDALLESFRIAPLRERKPDAISGGERQRVALARSLVVEPEALLLDEPLAALDVPTRGLILDDLRRWSATRAMPIVYVTHSRDEVFALAQRVIVLERGRVIADGTPQQVLDAPAREWTALAAGFENVFDAEVVELHASGGTMTCRLSDDTTRRAVMLEAPLGKARVGERLRIGVRAGDVLLASSNPQGLSARNVLPARVVDVEMRGAMGIVRLDCGVVIEAHVTAASCERMRLVTGRELWIVIKTHSCHLFRSGE
jgi:molybdate transport system ATP-binding protein